MEIILKEAKPKFPPSVPYIILGDIEKNKLHYDFIFHSYMLMYFISFIYLNRCGCVHTHTRVRFMILKYSTWLTIDKHVCVWNATQSFLLLLCNWQMHHWDTVNPRNDNLDFLFNNRSNVVCNVLIFIFGTQAYVFV